MSFLSSIIDFFKELFSGIIKFLKENLLLIILIVVGIYYLAPGLLTAIGEWLVSAASATWSWLGSAAGAAFEWLGSLGMADMLLLGAAVWFVSDPEGFVEFVAGVITKFVSAVSEGLGLPTMAMIGFGLYLFMSSDSKEEEDNGALV